MADRHMAQTGPEFPKRQWKLDHLLIPNTWMPLRWGGKFDPGSGKGQIPPDPFGFSLLSQKPLEGN